MRLTRRFTRLGLSCDTGRLGAALAAVRPEEWRAHPTGFPGNSAALLVTVGGGQNDDFAHSGQLAPTPLLRRLPYVRQIMGALASPISRSRFMRLAPGQWVPWHDDVGWHWFDRIRVHVPVVTDPAVTFFCADEQVHMAPGEVWIFDNFDRHGVRNDSAITRVHLVIDIVPTPAFFELVERSAAGAERVPIEADGEGDADHPVSIEAFGPRCPDAQRLAGLVRDIASDVDRLALRAGQRRRLKDALDALAGADGDYARFRRAARRVVRLTGPSYLQAGGEEPWASFGFLSGLSIGKTRGADAVRVLAEIEQATVAHAELGLRHVVGALGPMHGLRWHLRHVRYRRAQRRGALGDP